MVDHILNFFISKEIPISRKILISIAALIVCFFINNYYGFTYYFFNSQKAEYLSKIENIKQSSKKDQAMYKYLNSMEQDALNRKNLFDIFISLFKNTTTRQPEIYSHTHSNNKNPTTIKNNSPIQNNFFNKFFPIEMNRNQTWHTITSAFIPLVTLILIVIAFIPTVIVTKKDKIGMIAFLFMIISFLIFWIMFAQWIFGLIPIILHRAYINYTIQILINFGLIYCIYKFGINKKDTGN